MVCSNSSCPYHGRHHAWYASWLHANTCFQLQPHASSIRSLYIGWQTWQSSCAWHMNLVYQPAQSHVPTQACHVGDTQVAKINFDLFTSCTRCSHVVLTLLHLVLPTPHMLRTHFACCVYTSHFVHELHATCTECSHPAHLHIVPAGDCSHWCGVQACSCQGLQ